jgi:hypothetical protein
LSRTGSRLVSSVLGQRKDCLVTTPEAQPRKKTGVPP